MRTPPDSIICCPNDIANPPESSVPTDWSGKLEQKTGAENWSRKLEQPTPEVRLCTGAGLMSYDQRQRCADDPSTGKFIFNDQQQRSAGKAQAQNQPNDYFRGPKGGADGIGWVPLTKRDSLWNETDSESGFGRCSVCHSSCHISNRTTFCNRKLVPD